MKRTLPSLRVSEETLFNMAKAIEKHNKNSLTKLSIQEFRRVSLELLSQTILQNRKDILEIIDISD